MHSSFTRRHLFTASAALAFSACNRNKGSGYFGYALVANQGDPSVSAVDLTAFRLAKTISLRSAPTAVVAAQHGRHSAYVLTPDSGSVHAIDVNLSLSASERLADKVNEIRLGSSGDSLAAISEPARELILAEASSLHVLARHKLRFAPTAMDLAENGYAAVAGSQGQVSLLQLESGKFTHTELSHTVGAITFRADGKLLLVANLEGKSILALDVPTLRVVAELPLAMQPENLCFNADRGQLFVSGAGMDGVAVVFPFDTLEVDQTLLAGHAPGPMACSAAPAYLFVASDAGPSVSVINIFTRKQLALVEVGGMPTFVTTTPDSQYALILSEASGDMAVIHIPAIRTAWTAGAYKNGSALFTMLNVGSKPVHAAIVPRKA
jgi:DNA-binding beta-propeller fold protein YncE